ncbi:MAG: SDR family oxidoreductase [Acidimicrobiales bacterium]|nr:SDR family oxidoreductase [Acidimicrobiales bacterium]
MGSIGSYSVLITGGGSGIGEAAAAKLAADGANVTICGRTEDKLIGAVDRISASAAEGVTVHHVIADVTDEAAVQAAVAAATEQTGRLDGLFACAGGSTGIGPLATSDVDTIRSTMELNYIGTFLCIKYGGRQMARQGGGGSIIGCSSHAGTDSFRCLGAYGAAKAGLDHLCRTAADEMGEFGVRVNSVQPGIVGTDLMTPITGGGRLLDDYIPQIPLGRIGQPEEIAEMVRFLIGPESSWITGQNFAVDGGQNLRRGADYGEMLREFGADPMGGIITDA